MTPKNMLNSYVTFDPFMPIDVENPTAESVPLHRQAQLGSKSTGSKQKQGTKDCSNPVPNPPCVTGRERIEQIIPSGRCGCCSQV